MEPNPPPDNQAAVDLVPAVSGSYGGLRHFFGMAAVYCALGFILFHQGFGSGLIYDSVWNLQDNASVFARGSLVDVIKICPNRPLAMASFFWDFLLWGMDPAAWRAVDVVLLAVSGAVFAFVVMLLLRTPAAQGLKITENDRLSAGWLAGLLFVVHPLQSFVVLYLWQRASLLAGLFFLASMAVYFAVRLGTIRCAGLGYAITGLFVTCGLLSKENLIALPPVLVIAELVLFRCSLRELVRRSCVIALITLPALLVYLTSVHFLHSAQSTVAPGVGRRLGSHLAVAGLSPLEIIMTGCRVIWSYVGMIAAPSVDTLELVKAETISRSVWEPRTTALACAGMAALVLGPPAAIRRFPLPAFGIWFFAVTIIPQSVLSPQLLFVGHRAVLPMAGLFIAFVAAGIHVSHAAERFRYGTYYQCIPAVAAIGVAAWWSAVTFAYASVWNPLQFWEAAFRRLPTLSDQVEKKPYLDILSNYGLTLVGENRHAEAIPILWKAVDLLPDPLTPSIRLPAVAEEGFSARKTGGTPGFTKIQVIGKSTIAGAWINLGLALHGTGNAQDAADLYERATRIDPESSQAYFNLGLALRDLGNIPEAIRAYRIALEKDPFSARTANNLGRALEAAGRTDEAAELYVRTSALGPNLAEPHYNLGNLLMRSGNMPAAAEQFTLALRKRPSYAEAEANLGVVLLQMGQHAEAAERLRRALQTIRGNAELHNALGVAAASGGNKDEAVDQFRAALAIDPAHAGARRNLELLLGKEPQGG